MFKCFICIAHHAHVAGGMEEQCISAPREGLVFVRVTVEYVPRRHLQLQSSLH